MSETKGRAWDDIIGDLGYERFSKFGKGNHPKVARIKHRPFLVGKISQILHRLKEDSRIDRGAAGCRDCAPPP